MKLLILLVSTYVIELCAKIRLLTEFRLGSSMDMGWLYDDHHNFDVEENASERRADAETESVCVVIDGKLESVQCIQIYHISRWTLQSCFRTIQTI